MNYFGHAVIATGQHRAPAFVLGAMLPDLERMAGSCRSTPVDPQIRRGVEIHHRTDAVFHELPEFLELCRHARTDLMTAGVPRPSALAIAHIGIEFVLDGALCTDEVAAACTIALTLPAPAIDFDDRQAQRRFDGVRHRLAEVGPASYRDPSICARRLAMTLARRPRLALPDGHLQAVARWVADVTPAVTARAPALRDAVIAGLQPA